MHVGIGVCSGQGEKSLCESFQFKENTISIYAYTVYRILIAQASALESIFKSSKLTRGDNYIATSKYTSIGYM